MPGDKPTVPWTDAEVAAAKAACVKQLAGVRLDYKPLPPIKDGICGAPAPILVSSIGDVAISPPATMRCVLAVKLDGWLQKRVQPKAKATLGSAVVEIHNATSYSCRNRYGGANTRISEHALANALDISEFVLASGERVTVLKSWPRVLPPPEAEPRLESIAEAPTGAIVAVSNRVAAPEPVRRDLPKVTPSSNPFVPSAAPSNRGAANTHAAGDPRTNPFVAPVSVAAASPPLPPPVAEPPEVEPPVASLPEAKPADAIELVAERRSDFVRSIHGDACQIFGTVLGPEANDAHKNHFHLDMKARRHSAFCE